MALFGGSKSSNTTNVTETNLNSVDNRVGEAGAVFGGNLSVSPINSSGDISVNMTDLGAIKGGLDLAGESLGFARGIGSDAIKSAQDIAARSITEQSALALAARQSEAAGGFENFLKYGAIVAAVAVVGFLVYKSQ